MSGFTVFVGAVWSLFCFLAGGFTFSPKFREWVILKVRTLRSNRKVKAEPSQAWRQDVGLHPRRSEVSAAAPIAPSPDPRGGGVAPELRDEGTPASGPQREPQPVPAPASAPVAPSAGNNGRMSVEEAKQFLKKKGYNVKRKRRPQAP